MSGTIRTYERHVLDRVLRRIEEILRGVTSAWGAAYRFDTSTLGAVVNDAACAATVAGAAAAFLGPDCVAETQVTGADDMCRFLEERPGAFFLLGAAPRGAAKVYSHHHPKFDFDESCLPLGVEIALRVIEAATGSELG